MKTHRAKARLALLCLCASSSALLLAAPRTLSAARVSVESVARRVQKETEIDPAALIREVARNERAMQPRRLEYTWTTREVRRDVNERGEVKGENVEVFETYPIKGEFARKLVSKNGVAVSPERAERELKKAVEDIEKAERESQKKAQEKAPTEAPSAPQSQPDIPTFGFSSGYAHRSGFSSGEFTFAPWRFFRAAEFYAPRRERLNGRDTIVLDFRPRADFRPANDIQKPYAKLSGRVWIDAEDKALARLEAWPDPSQPLKKTASISAASASNPSIVYEEARLPDGLWIQNLLRIRTAGHKEVFNGMNLDVSKEASDFKRFSAEAEEKLNAPKEKP